MVFDGQKSEFTPRPLVFLIYINDISCGLSSNIRLFPDDCIPYCIIKEKHDQEILQADINQLMSGQITGS